MVEYRKATLDDLEYIWNVNIADNPGDSRWVKWKKEFVSYNLNGDSATFVIIIDGKPIGEGTLLFSPKCSAIRERTELADGKKIANINALRIRKEYEGKGYISKLVKMMEKYAVDNRYTYITIGVEARETRNLAIYLHWGYDTFVTAENEDGELVLYYAKNLNTKCLSE